MFLKLVFFVVPFNKTGLAGWIKMENYINSLYCAPVTLVNFSLPTVQWHLLSSSLPQKKNWMTFGRVLCLTSLVNSLGTEKNEDVLFFASEKESRFKTSSPKPLGSCVTMHWNFVSKSAESFYRPGVPNNTKKIFWDFILFCKVHAWLGKCMECSECQN